MNDAKTPSHSCGRCGQSIRDRYLIFADGRYWHSGCFKCSICLSELARVGKSFYSRDNLILCREDYIMMFRSFGECKACHKKIPPTEMVMKVCGNVYHIQCLVCSRCHCALSTGQKYKLCKGGVVCCNSKCKFSKRQ